MIFGWSIPLLEQLMTCIMVKCGLQPVVMHQDISQVSCRPAFVSIATGLNAPLFCTCHKGDVYHRCNVLL